MKPSEEDFLKDYLQKPYHRFWELERYVTLMEKMKTEADRQTTF